MPKAKKSRLSSRKYRDTKGRQKKRNPLPTASADHQTAETTSVSQNFEPQPRVEENAGVEIVAIEPGTSAVIDNQPPVQPVEQNRENFSVNAIIQQTAETNTSQDLEHQPRLDNEENAEMEIATGEPGTSAVETLQSVEHHPGHFFVNVIINKAAEPDSSDEDEQVVDQPMINDIESICTDIDSISINSDEIINLDQIVTDVNRNEEDRIFDYIPSPDNDDVDIIEEDILPSQVIPDIERVIPHHLGQLTERCEYCRARFFTAERKQRLHFGVLCCNAGKVVLPPLRQHPELLQRLFIGNGNQHEAELSRQFRKKLNVYNNCFQFASVQTNLRNLPGRGPQVYAVQGKIYHHYTDVNVDREHQTFASIYFLDPEAAINERLHGANENGIEVNPELIRIIENILRDTNPFARQYHHLHTVWQQQTADGNNNVPRVFLEFVDQQRQRNRREHDPRQVEEIAAVCQYNEDDAPDIRMRVFLRNDDSGLRNIDLHSEFCDPLSFPLLFPYGDLGWHLNLRHNGRNITLCQYYCYRLADRYDPEEANNFQIFRYAGYLKQSFIVLAYLKIEHNRITYVKSNQPRLRAQSYHGLIDYLHRRAEGEGDIPIGRLRILPSTFAMSPRAQMQRYQDALAVMSKIGYPTYFITVTCNPKWPEIQNNIPAQSNTNEFPLLICRVFMQKLKAIMHELTENGIFGRCIAHLYVIEFQKRGLPHAHILITVREEDRPSTPEQIDAVISAEIPNHTTHPQLYELVKRHMIHGPCGIINPQSVCMVNNKCSKQYPKYWYNNTTIQDGNINYRRRRNGRQIQLNAGRFVDNSWVVPHNPYLLMRYQTHINVELCLTTRTIKYLYKYFFKSPDQALVRIEEHHDEIIYDEIDSYLNGRYITPPEAAWHILQLPIHNMSHVVIRLPVHLPEQQQAIFREGHEQEAVERHERTMLTEWFATNREVVASRRFLYVDFPIHYVWMDRERRWKPRDRGGEKIISRLYNISLRTGELYYLRMLLLHVRGATSFEYLRTVNNRICPTFQEACRELNLLAEDQEWFRSLDEASRKNMPNEMRKMFAYILIFGTVDNPPALWEQFQHYLFEDFVRLRNLNQEDAINATLYRIQCILQVHGRRLSDFGLIEPPENIRNWIDEQQQQPDVDQSQNRRIVDDMIARLNNDQRHVFNVITTSIANNENRGYFVKGAAGTGKTFLYNSLILHQNNEGNNVIAVACTGLAAALLKDGRTVHSMFRLPVPTLNNSTSMISRESLEAEQLRQAKLIIWDEVSMATGILFKAVDNTLRDLCQIDQPFGGKCIIIGGDFKQCLPIIRNGSRTTVVDASVKNCHFWRENWFQPMQLLQNMRIENDEVDFMRWLNQLGNGTLRSETGRRQTIDIPQECVVATLDELITNIFGLDLQSENIVNRAILTPLNAHCNQINQMILDRLLHGQEQNYFSVDTIDSDDPAEINHFPVEFLNTINPLGFPPHKLCLKKGAVVMLLKNLNVQENLCNGTRLLIKELSDHYIDAQIIDFDGHLTENRILIPRIDFRITDNNLLPFTLVRRQFPVKLSYAMTINKAQGQTLDAVGIYLPNPVFDHGQLYVAFSRARTKRHLFVCIEHTNEQGQVNIEGRNVTFTKNIVYREVLDTT